MTRALAGEEQEFQRTLVDPSGRTRHSQVSYVPDTVEWRGRRALRARHRRHRAGGGGAPAQRRAGARRGGQLDAGPRDRLITWSSEMYRILGRDPRHVHPTRPSPFSRRCIRTTATAWCSASEEARASGHGYELSYQVDPPGRAGPRGPQPRPHGARGRRCRQPADRCAPGHHVVQPAGPRSRSGQRRAAAGQPAQRRRPRRGRPRRPAAPRAGPRTPRDARRDLAGVVGRGQRGPGREGARGRPSALGPPRRHPRDGQLRVGRHRHPPDAGLPGRGGHRCAGRHPGRDRRGGTPVR